MIKNVSLASFKRFLKYKGLKHIRTTGGHEVYSKKELLRPVILQSHIDPVPIHIIKSNLRTIGVSLQEFSDWISSN